MNCNVNGFFARLVPLSIRMYMFQVAEVTAALRRVSHSNVDLKKYPCDVSHGYLVGSMLKQRILKHYKKI